MSSGKDFKYALSKGKVLRGGKYAYCVESVLGQGGYGFTYKVSFKTKIGNIPVTLFFAVKELFVKGHCYRGADGLSMEYSEASASEVKENLQDFITEGNRLAQLCKNNKNIVNVNEVFEANNTAYYVMEYLDGGDLRQKVLANRGGLSEEQALSYVRPIAEAVASLHGERMLHLDIKPENIVIRSGTDGHGDEPVLIDFGVSLHFNKKGELTSKHDSIGVSMGYSAPEQLEGITHFAPEVDVYSLGATLYYLLSGRSPQSPSDMQPDYIRRTLPQSVSEQVKEAIIHALCYNKYERTKTVSDFIHELTYEEQPEPEPVLPKELPAMYILNGISHRYQILSVKDKSDRYIHYIAVRYTGPGDTAKMKYDLYEFFVEGVHERQKDYSIVSKEDDERYLSEYFKDAEQKTGLVYQQGKCVADDSKTREIFPANGSVYAAILQGKKSNPKPNAIVEWIKENRKNVIRGAAVLCVLLLGYGCWQLLKDSDNFSRNGQKTEDSTESIADYNSRLLTKYIENNDSTWLCEFASHLDSTRAYLPYAKILIAANKKVEAREYVEKAVEAGVEGASDLFHDLEGSGVSSTDNTAAQTNVGSSRSETTSTSSSSTEKKNNTPNTSNTVDKKQNTSSQKNEQAEAAKKALQYINGERTYENHQKAYEWALKADAATKAKVLQRLKDMDFPIP